MMLMMMVTEFSFGKLWWINKMLLGQINGVLRQIRFAQCSNSVCVLGQFHQNIVGTINARSTMQFIFVVVVVVMMMMVMWMWIIVMSFW